MNRRRYGPVRYAASIIFSYAMFISLTVFISGLILLTTVMNPSYMIKRAVSGGFSRLALSEMQEIYISHGAASGIPRDIMLSALTQKHIDDIISAALQDAYYTGPAYAFYLYEDELFDTFMAYALDYGAKDTDELREGIRDLAVLCVSDLSDHLISPVISTIGEAAVNNRFPVTAAVAMMAVLMILFAVLLWALNRRISAVMGAYIYTLGAAALVCALIPALIYGSGITRRLGITPMSYNRLFSSWLEGIAEGFLFALIPVVLLLTVFAVIWVTRRRRRRRLGHR